MIAQRSGPTCSDPLRAAADCSQQHHASNDKGTTVEPRRLAKFYRNESGQTG